jgi:hypothetical protein
MGTGHITETIGMRITVATREHGLTVATATGPACQRPNVATDSSKFSPTSLSKMKTNDVKNSYCPEGTRDYTNSTIIPFNFLSWQKVFKKFLWKVPF